jgi:hypothetical protein
MRITADVLKARIQTVGVEEHPLKMERGTTLRTRKYFSCSRTDNAFATKDSQLWSIIDVGGSRGSRGA